MVLCGAQRHAPQANQSGTDERCCQDELCQVLENVFNEEQVRRWCCLTTLAQGTGGGGDKDDNAELRVQIEALLIIKTRIRPDVMGALPRPKTANV